MPSTALERSTVRLMRCRVSWMRDCAVSSSRTFCMPTPCHRLSQRHQHDTVEALNLKAGTLLQRCWGAPQVGWRLCCSAE